MAHTDLVNNRSPPARTWSSPHTPLRICIPPYAFHNQLLRSSPGAEPSEGCITVYGSFTTTKSAADWLRTKIKIPARPRGQKYAAGRCDSDTPPDSPLSSRSPSISRMSDSGWGEASLNFANSTEPVSHSVGIQRLHPTLEALERASKLSCPSRCSTCMKPGRDFPHCWRCGQMWCSRECRLQGGKKHMCPSRQN